MMHRCILHSPLYFTFVLLPKSCRILQSLFPLRLLQVLGTFSIGCLFSLKVLLGSIAWLASCDGCRLLEDEIEAERQETTGVFGLPLSAHTCRAPARFHLVLLFDPTAHSHNI